MKGSFGQVVIHPTAYDGCVELAAIHHGMWVMGSSTLEMNYKSAKDHVKNFLIQDWLTSSTILQCCYMVLHSSPALLVISHLP